MHTRARVLRASITRQGRHIQTADLHTHTPASHTHTTQIKHKVGTSSVFLGEVILLVSDIAKSSTQRKGNQDGGRKISKVVPLTKVATGELELSIHFVAET